MRLEIVDLFEFFSEVIGYNSRIFFGSLNRKKGASMYE